MRQGRQAMTTKRDPLPAWLRDQLVRDGHMTEGHVTRKVRPRRCKACRAACLAAIDDTGFESWVDPAPLTTQGELFALLAGRATFMTFGEELCFRDAGRISHRNADTIAVYAEHSCGSRMLPSKSPPTRNVATDPNNPPF